ncbi:envelope stress response membrane protein PspB [Vibrio salinus]|uniref:envelope stress response membrane protein PspB n=1 Tax=Vibrio salinus TaxID=2899784 RepID=UPI001E391212|nr:envelope stress response membrane protein PspB [Vibrio salinus]MCE0492646.1 envelope stress response membrane protein PspB [Vibrio salinus]
MMFPIIFVPLVIFVLIVAPLWLILHYRSKRYTSQGLNEDELQQLHQLIQHTESLKQRVKTLEKILDDEAPNWRGYDGK